MCYRWAMRSSLVVLIFAATTAHADPAADATKAFTAFVDGVAAGKAQPGLELFITPFRDDDPVPKDLTAVKKLLDKQKVKVGKVVVSKAGKSAWLIADITARVPRNGKLKSEALRASALLVLDGTAWRVRATEWSAAVPNHPTNMCGLMDREWHFTPSVPADLVAPVAAVIAALADMPSSADLPVAVGPSVREPFLKLLSDDPNAVVIGSAPNEKFTGGAAIKKLFKKWNVTWGGDGEDVSKDKGPVARAGAGPDGELLWLYTTASSHEQCTDYRALFVLAKEPAGWRIVHQHYSEQIVE
jgi:ketosteroid isomerase-like protein